MLIISNKGLLNEEICIVERRKIDRKDFSYYMQLVDDKTHELVGHLADISSRGFKLDKLSPIPPEKDIRFRMELTDDVADKPYMVFITRSKWCKVDPFNPFCYNVGIQLINITPTDIEIFNRLIEKYGSKHEQKHVDLRRTHMW